MTNAFTKSFRINFDQKTKERERLSVGRFVSRGKILTETAENSCIGVDTSFGSNYWFLCIEVGKETKMKAWFG